MQKNLKFLSERSGENFRFSNENTLKICQEIAAEENFE